MPPDSGEQLTIDSLNNPGYYQSRNFCEREHDKRLTEGVRAAEVSLLLLKRGRGSKPSKFVDSTKLIHNCSDCMSYCSDSPEMESWNSDFQCSLMPAVQLQLQLLCSFSDFLNFLRLLLCSHMNAHMFAWSSQRVHNNMFNIIEYSTVSTTYQPLRHRYVNRFELLDQSTPTRSAASLEYLSRLPMPGLNYVSDTAR